MIHRDRSSIHWSHSSILKQQFLQNRPRKHYWVLNFRPCESYDEFLIYQYDGQLKLRNYTTLHTDSLLHSQFQFEFHYHFYSYHYYQSTSIGLFIYCTWRNIIIYWMDIFWTNIFAMTFAIFENLIFQWPKLKNWVAV